MASPLSLTDDDIRILEEQRILLPESSSVTGKRKISATFLTPPDTDAGSSSGSSRASTATLSFKRHAVDSSFDVVIPIAEESLEALEFLGFTYDAANKIFTNFRNRPANQPIEDDLLAFADAHVKTLNLLARSNLSDGDKLTHIGIKKSLQDAILDPAFRVVFSTESLLFWVIDTLHINYWTLHQLQSRLKERASHGRRHRARKSQRISISEVFPQTASSSYDPTATNSELSNDYHFPKACVLVKEAEPIMEDHVVLYKGKAASEMVEGSQWIQDDGTLEMGALANTPRGDFNPFAMAWYFTPEKDVAEEYRGYAANRCPNSETWLIRLEVPKAFLNSLRKRDLWYGADWREYVWHCRKGRQPPSKYDTLHIAGMKNSVDVIRGAVCFAISEKVHKIPLENIHQQMTQSQVVMKCSTGSATQVAFLNSKVADRLGQQVRGKIHIDVFQPKNPDKSKAA